MDQKKNMDGWSNRRNRLMRIEQSIRTVLGAAALCWALVSAGCNGAATTSLTQTAATPRADWGMTLLAGGGVGADQFPAKFTFDVNATPDCVKDFVAYNTGLAGVSGSTANIVAFNQLYSTQPSAGGLCAQIGPSVYWSYFTGTGQALTSAVLSFDGSKVAFVENGASGATLRILAWKAGEGTGAGAPVPVDQDISGHAWSTCIVPANSCVASIGFNGGAQDTNSAPFYDYGTDVLYVGDNNGKLHKFTGVFNGTPAEVTSGWPITVNVAGTILTGPVYDGVSGNIFVGDSTARLSFIQEVGSTVGGTTPCTPLPCLNTVNRAVGTGTGATIADAPVVDGTNGTVFAFGTTNPGTATVGTVLQATTGLTSPVSFGLGGGNILCNSSAVCSPVYSGAFDNAYITSTHGAVVGHMYVCGKEPSPITDRPAIYQLSFDSNGVLTGVGSPLTGLALSSTEACSPVTEVYNSTAPAVDWIFFSVGSRANFPTSGTPTNAIPAGSTCATIAAAAAPAFVGCLLSINVTTASTWPPAPAVVTSAVPTPPTPTPGTSFNPSSTSGIVVDNIASTATYPQASSTYFSFGVNSTATTTCNGTVGIGCAVKLTQAGLQ